MCGCSSWTYSGGRAAPVRTQECLSWAGACVLAKPSRFQLSLLQSTLEAWRAGLTWIISRSPAEELANAIHAALLTHSKA